MVEKTSRSGGESGPRSADGRRFEVFIRDAAADPMRHVGTVAAPTPDAAHEEASTLFGWYARDVWVAPAAEVHRYSAESLGDGTDGESDGEDGDGSPGRGGDDDGEPRVHEETEGTPTIACGGPRPSADRDADRDIDRDATRDDADDDADHESTPSEDPDVGGADR